MKPTRMQAVKRDLNVISRGLRNGVRVLIAWITEPSDKDIVKRRLLITLSVPAGLSFLGSQYPVIAITGGLVLFGGAIFWFARTQQQQMTFHAVDFTGPYQVGQRIMDFSELLAHLVAAHPGGSLEALGDRLYNDFHGPDLDDGEIAVQIRRLGLKHSTLASPSPAGQDVPPSAEKDTGQSAAEGAPEGASPGQGSAKAWLSKTGLLNRVKSYAGSSAKEGETGGEHQEKGDVRVDQDGQPDSGPVGEEGPSGDSGGPPVRDAGGHVQDPGGVPDQDERPDPAPHEEVAQGA